MSPFRSKKQEGWMWANKPELAKKWTKKYGSLKEKLSKRARNVSKA